jgi:hypothetical protein
LRQIAGKRNRVADSGAADSGHADAAAIDDLSQLPDLVFRESIDPSAARRLAFDHPDEGKGHEQLRHFGIGAPNRPGHRVNCRQGRYWASSLLKSSISQDGPSAK